MPYVVLLFLLCLHLAGLAQGVPELKVIGENEQGKPFTLMVTVYDVDSRMPISGAEVFMYQTNHLGEYERDANNVARIHGTGNASAGGQLKLITIYPRGYDNAPTGEHMHFRVTADGYRRSVADLIFADYHRQRYDFDNPYTYKVYLKTLEERDGKLYGDAAVYLKKM